ncbi:DUF6714 family protein [Pseudomonas oryziphila]|uniref:Uncharacterized protein n=1 Tax=Pseudomonas oryziphila TaxID=2894079 RepID=A0ABN5TGX8_9PSED|nr:DUF6714 family protein [Pseudomonas oryziphila]AZL74393.1 hypothetical protein EI693_15440 [Pseudomonas oryziphila]
MRVQDTLNARQGSIRKMVEAAFKKENPPDASEIISSLHLEPLQIKDYFAGKRWWDITLQGLFDDYIGDSSACLTFMTSAGVEYYLPAYLLMAVEHYYDGGIVTEDFAYGLKRSIMRDDLYRMSLYGTEKKKAIVEVLVFLWKEYGDEEALETMRAIAVRWGGEYINSGGQE